jgi:hypothetical protein
MSFFKGLTSIAASPFTLVKKTAEAIASTPDEFSSDDGIDTFKAALKISTCGLSGIVEGAIKTCEKISDDFDED